MINIILEIYYIAKRFCCFLCFCFLLCTSCRVKNKLNEMLKD